MSLLHLPGHDTEEAQGYIPTPSGLYLPSDIAEERYAQRQPVGVSLFSGAGGFDLGMIQAGFHVAAAVEWWEPAVCTYMVNLCRWGQVKLHFIEPSDQERLEKYMAKEFKGQGLKKDYLVAGSGWIASEPNVRGTEHVFVGDVRKLSGKVILDALGMKRGDVDVVFGGPPCQGFSTSGKRDVMDERNSLVFDFCRLVCEINPKTMAMENVAGMVSMVTPEGVPVVEAIARILEDGGFAGYDSFRQALKYQFPESVGKVFGLTRSKKREAMDKRDAEKKAAKGAPKKKPGAPNVDEQGQVVLL